MDVGGLYGEYNLDLETLNLVATSDSVAILLIIVFQSTTLHKIMTFMRFSENLFGDQMNQECTLLSYHGINKYFRNVEI